MPQDSTRTILFGQGDVNQIMNPLIPFNCVYDLDFGLLRYMYENGYTSNDELIDDTIFQLIDTDKKKLISELYSRIEENPLNLCIKNIGSADELYNQFMEQHYGSIVRSSVRTGVYELCRLFKSEPTIKAAIIYSSEAEYYILSQDENLKHVELIDLETVRHRISEFNIYFFKSVSDMYIDLLTPLLKSKSIYILDYRFNFDENGEEIKGSNYISQLELQRNIISIINAYDRKRLGMEEVETDE